MMCLIPDIGESVTTVAKVKKPFIWKQNKQTLVGNSRRLDLANNAYCRNVELRTIKKKKIG